MSLPPDLGPYRIVRLLGAGGMGTVYEALDTTLERPVALKVISTVLADDPGFRERFVREARAQASLDSPHVVQVFAHGQVDGRLFLASQLVPDGDLAAMLRRQGPLPAATAVDLVAQVADGLAEAHRVGLVHRDIKPANVLLRNRGTDTVAYLADFGIAGRVGADPACADSACAGPAGTPGYLAPELLRGGSAGPASDLYALGCLLWATLTGRPPHAGASVLQLPGRTAYDRGLNRVLRSALAHRPQDRYPSAAAFRDDLRSLAGTPGAGRIPLPVLLPVLLAATVVLVAGLAGLMDRTEDADRREQTAITNIAGTLEQQAGLDSRSADCAARALVADHGVTGLQEAGVVDDDLVLVEDASGHVEPGVLDDVLTTTLGCLWSAVPR